MPKDPFAEFGSDPIDLDPLLQSASAVNQTVRKKVPNKQPSIQPSTLRLAIIGEAPGPDEEAMGQPFVGMSGRLLDQLLSKCGIARAQCFVGNIVQVRPPGNEISKFDRDGQEFAEGLDQLQKDLDLFKPNLCLLLGSTPFRIAKGSGSVFDWRGSLFISTNAGPFLNRKCLATLHPAYCLRQYDGLPLLTLDIRRAKQQATSPTLTLPNRDLQVFLPFTDLVAALSNVLETKAPVSCDIEGGVRNVSCIGFASTPTSGFVVPFSKLDGSSYWSDPTEEAQLWKLVAQILADAAIPKIWQSGLYDRFVLQWSHNLVVRNNTDDTLLKHWELYCEMEKSLGFMCSIYTDEPFYKFERKTEDQHTFYQYCAKDAAVTLEISNKLEGCLTPVQKEHYRFNLAVLNSLLYMEIRGIRYNQDEASLRLQNILTHVYKQQALLDSEAAKVGALPDPVDFTQPPASIVARIQSTCCYKRDPSTPKKDYAEDYNRLVPILLSGEPLTPELCGEVSALIGASMNTKGPAFKDFLYKHLGLPVQYKKDPKTKELRPTTDYNALLHLSKDHSHPALTHALELSRLRTRAQMLAIRSYQGRMHCSYNLVGSETGRVTSSKSMIYVGGKNRVGANMQTVPDDWEIFDVDHPVHQGMRDLLVADDGCYLGKADLKGADGWTIGAYMAMLGDRTMLDDLLYGIKPAQVVAYILVKGAEAYYKVAHDRNALHAEVQCIKKDMWQYFVSKIGIWGTFYTMGPRSLAGNVFVQSEGSVVLNEKQARDFQQCILVRYRAKLWQDWMQTYMSKQPYPSQLAAPNGHLRKFFGRKTDVLGQALAHMPQVVTTYATLMAAYRLWTDHENRYLENGKTKLIVEPLHQVHDELLMQWKIENTDFAKRKIKEWFNNPIIVANQKLIIPYDGAYGTAWSMGGEHKKGTL